MVVVDFGENFVPAVRTWAGKTDSLLGRAGHRRALDSIVLDLGRFSVAIKGAGGPTRNGSVEPHARNPAELASLVLCT